MKVEPWINQKLNQFSHVLGKTLLDKGLFDFYFNAFKFIDELLNVNCRYV